MSFGVSGRVPVVLMVSGGSDSTALLELAVRHMRGSATTSFKLDPCASRTSRLPGLVSAALPASDSCELSVLHVNHMLRGTQADDDEAFVRGLCRSLAVPCHVQRVDVARLPRARELGIEAAARECRYRCAEDLLASEQIRLGVEPDAGTICTAHTLDDRVETFYMRSLVGTGPGGLGSIPRRRGHVVRPLLDASREELRDWLRSCHPGAADHELWHDDPTNDDGSNFRGRVRSELIPVLERLRPGFKKSLVKSMDLIAEEDASISQAVDSIVYRNLSWDGRRCSLPVEVLSKRPRYLARRILRSCLLVVDPGARLESVQIDRVLEGLSLPRFTTEVSGGIRVRVCDGVLTASIEQ